MPQKVDNGDFSDEGTVNNTQQVCTQSVVMNTNEGWGK